MAFVITNLVAEPRSFSIGPIKAQIMTYSCLASDITGTVTADRLYNAFAVLSDGQLCRTAVDSFAGNAATVSFAIPGLQEYVTTVTAATATAGTLYYDSVGRQFSVKTAIAAAVTVSLQGSVAPAGTLTKASGMPAGDAATLVVSAAVGPTVRGTLIVLGY